MRKIGFDSEKFIKLEREEILRRIDKFDGKLYLELGGKIFDDLHASRVLPGYASNNKIKILESLKDQMEIIICISARDIAKNKIRSDFGITYDIEVFRLIDSLRALGLSINSVCITLFENQPSALKFGKLLENRGEKVYYHRVIENYPNDINTIMSDDGYGKNPYIETNRPLVVVSAPGPGSCKMATALSQLYHENLMGKKSGYAKLETFPVWDLSLDNPINIAYESATADLNDQNLLDHFHKNAYGVDAVNYNRDLQSFPVLSEILNRIIGKGIYKSPTDMGINVISQCISDMNACIEAGKQELIRRYLKAKVEYKKGLTSIDTVNRTLALMDKCHVAVEDRKVFLEAHIKQKEKDSHVVSIEMADGTIVTGKDQGVITATTGAVLNALKYLAHIPHNNIINHDAVKNIYNLKKFLNLGDSLDLKDIFIAMSIYSHTDESTHLALEEISHLKGLEAHATYMLPANDEDFLRKLKINITCDDVFFNQKLFN